MYPQIARPRLFDLAMLSLVLLASGLIVPSRAGEIDLWRHYQHEAKLAYNAGNYPLAETRFKTSAKMLASSGELKDKYALSLFNYGLFLKLRGREAEAAMPLYEALSIRHKILWKEHPDYIENRRELADLLLRMDHPPGALELLKADTPSIEDNKPLDKVSDGYIYLLLGYASYSKRQYKEAADQLTYGMRLLEGESSTQRFSARPLVILANCCLQLGQIARAAKLSSQALDSGKFFLTPQERATALMTLMQCKLNDRRLDQVRILCHQLAELHNRPPLSSSKERNRVLLAIAHNAIAAHDLALANQALESIKRTNPNAFPYRRGLQFLLLSVAVDSPRSIPMRDRLDRFMKVTAPTISKWKISQESIRNHWLAELSFSRQQWQNAIALYDASLNYRDAGGEFRGYRTALSKLGKAAALTMVGRTAESRELLESFGSRRPTSRKDSPHRARVALELGYVYYKEGNLLKAEQYFKESLHLMQKQRAPSLTILNRLAQGYSSLLRSTKRGHQVAELERQIAAISITYP